MICRDVALAIFHKGRDSLGNRVLGAEDKMDKRVEVDIQWEGIDIAGMRVVDT